MKSKIIKVKGCKTCSEVLVYLTKDDEGEEYVSILAWHNYKDKDYLQEGQLDSMGSSDNINHLQRQRLIADFSETSAKEFLDQMVF